MFKKGLLVAINKLNGTSLQDNFSTTRISSKQKYKRTFSLFTLERVAFVK